MSTNDMRDRAGQRALRRAAPGEGGADLDGSAPRWPRSAPRWRAPSPPTARGRQAPGRRRRGQAIGHARELARAVAGGSLIKAGIFGGDPSWGRILAALGARIGARDLPVDPARRHPGHPGRARLRGRAPGGVRRGAAVGKMRRRDRRSPRLRPGPARARALGCDLSYEYVKINAEYYATPVGIGGGAPGGRRSRRICGRSSSRR